MTTTITHRQDSELAADAAVFSDALGELIRVVQFRDRDRACCYELSVSQCYALKAVADASGLTVNELAGYLYLDKSTASRIANGLVEKDLVVRERSEADGRIVHLVVTDAGREVHDRIEHDLAEEYAELLEDFDPAFRSAVVKLVRRLRRSFAARVDTEGGSCCVVTR
ncbi:MAG: MarR family transcriptional regulator [Gemmatimonadetes bacterium]|nr:MarR family transcriptional regulator [Gemmatimonadota bacterium]NNL29605.1 MarR family transcriptional regulator [Gemmatimonadota bacterium]